MLILLETFLSAYEVHHYVASVLCGLEICAQVVIIVLCCKIMSIAAQPAT